MSPLIDETLRKRLMTSAVLITVTVSTIFLAPEWFFFMVVQAFSLLALNEFISLAEKKSVKVNRVLTLLFGAMIPFSAYYSSEPMVLGIAVLGLFLANFEKESREQSLINVGVSSFGLLYVCALFSQILKIRHMPDGSGLVFYALLLAKGGDAGAYFVGKKYGKVKLIEHISPNKSVEGAVGGLLTTVALSLISKIYLPSISFSHLFLMGVGIGVISQLGDLAESLIKRDAGIKDSGVIPGLGGILDVLDSVVFTFPFVYYYVAFVL